jgi:phosphoribosylformimino-5-aminoimidazole carboxamide ribotide isomerase
VLYTDISRDGMRAGPNLDATGQLVHRLLPTPVIASGGVARLEDLDALAPTGASAVVVGKALYEQVFTIEQAVARMRAQSR